ncbi:MAG: thioredoxin family protein [Pseudomonadota bacterium]
MDRRTFLVTAVAAAAASPALAEKTYAPGLVEKELAAGKTVFVGFSADWCSTCRAQESKMRKLKAENPAYEANITFIRADWDRHGNGKLANRLNIPRRSTLVVLKGDQELGRVVASTRTDKIKELMDIALAAAVA